MEGQAPHLSGWDAIPGAPSFFFLRDWNPNYFFGLKSSDAEFMQ
jgi:hypothetical protein